MKIDKKAILPEPSMGVLALLFILVSKGYLTSPEFYDLYEKLDNAETIDEFQKVINDFEINLPE